VEKAKQKIVEDKTFGLKNKNKSKTVQNYIKGVAHQVGGVQKGGLSAIEQKEFAERAEKKKQKEEEAFLNSLSKTVNVIKQAVLEDGQKAQDVLCEYFKKDGSCPYGDACEFSHDINIEFNQGTFDIYTDLRNVKGGGKEMEMFRLAEERDGKRKKVQSTIVCKFFLDAIHKKVYGLKWDCPNGDECQYRHCIPKDYILKSKQAKQEDMTFEEFLNLEEQIDEERTRITQFGRPVTDENYEVWRKARDERRDKTRTEKEKEFALRQTGIQLFQNSQKNNIVIQDDEGAAEELKAGNAEDIDVLEEIVERDIFFKDIKDDENTLDELSKQLKGIKVNAELFGGDENLDDLDNLEDDEKNNNEEKKPTL